MKAARRGDSRFPHYLFAPLMLCGPRPGEFTVSDRAPIRFYGSLNGL